MMMNMGESGSLRVVADFVLSLSLIVALEWCSAIGFETKDFASRVPVTT
jgi:hypothetical protein